MARESPREKRGGLLFHSLFQPRGRFTARIPSEGVSRHAVPHPPESAAMRATARFCTTCPSGRHRSDGMPAVGLRQQKQAGRARRLRRPAHFNPSAVHPPAPAFPVSRLRAGIPVSGRALPRTCCGGVSSFWRSPQNNSAGGHIPGRHPGLWCLSRCGRNSCIPTP